MMNQALLIASILAAVSANPVPAANPAAPTIEEVQTIFDNLGITTMAPSQAHQAIIGELVSDASRRQGPLVQLIENKCNGCTEQVDQCLRDGLQLWQLTAGELGSAQIAIDSSKAPSADQRDAMIAGLEKRISRLNNATCPPYVKMMENRRAVDELLAHNNVDLSDTSFLTDEVKRVLPTNADGTNKGGFAAVLAAWKFTQLCDDDELIRALEAKVAEIEEEVEDEENVDEDGFHVIDDIEVVKTRLQAILDTEKCPVA